MAVVALCGALLLSACSGSDPIELPDTQDGVALLDHVTAETQLDIVLLSVSQTHGTPVSWEQLYDVTDSGADAVIDHYDAWLTERGWERVEGGSGIPDSLGATWERGDQDVVLARLHLEGRDIIGVLATPEGQ